MSMDAEGNVIRDTIVDTGPVEFPIRCEGAYVVHGIIQIVNPESHPGKTLFVWPVPGAVVSVERPER